MVFQWNPEHPGITHYPGSPNSWQGSLDIWWPLHILYLAGLMHIGILEPGGFGDWQVTRVRQQSPEKRLLQAYTVWRHMAQCVFSPGLYPVLAL